MRTSTIQQMAATAVSILACCSSLLAQQNALDEEAGVSSAPRELWVTHQRDSKISILSFPNGRSLAEFSLPGGTNPHITTFHSGAYAYISGMGNGTLSIVDASSRKLVQMFSFAPTLCHQGKVSPDGTTMLVSVISTQMLHKVAVNEANQSWIPVGGVSFEPLGRRPICTVFRADSKRAYVSMLPDGIAIVDVPSMSILGTLATDGFIACGMIKPPANDSRGEERSDSASHADHAVIASSGGGGHIYTLDMRNDTLVDRGTLGARSWHSFNMTPDESIGFGTSPNSDEAVVVIDLTTLPVTNLGKIPLQPLPGAENNQPDAMGGGEAIVDGTLPVSLRAAGQVALIRRPSGPGGPHRTEFIKIADPSLPGTINPMNCNECSVHGITVRPLLRSDRDTAGR